jgi:hypothetical protein
MQHPARAPSGRERGPLALTRPAPVFGYDARRMPQAAPFTSLPAALARAAWQGSRR